MDFLMSLIFDDFTLIRLMDFLITMIRSRAPFPSYSGRPFLTVILLIGAVLAFGQGPKKDATGLAMGKGGTSVVALAKADSLFAARQYTQAFEYYYAIQQQGSWSPAMLLKMAYIQEGLGRLGESMYYLNLYTLASHDPQAVKKMEELAEKNQLEGYVEDPMDPLYTALREYYMPLGGVLAAVSILMLALMANQYRRKQNPSRVLAGTLTLLLASLFTHVFFSLSTQNAIVTRSNTYLMTGPSAGSSVVEIIGEGHKLRILDKTDVWLKVEWKEKEVYVRDFLTRPVQL
jgi:hypothetical protein